ncbi:hypothetical protein HBA54_00620 [Pelagibius litoralis]|uniref:Uncharacterized protein n=1 Tax=Pelagibius litoralis TaxID=374515 RepID=A0A967C2H8_9PROT|nr:hypothetical protein [Pelagibius litoralis]NIA67089.1 hypothetical protein [Pelagibius litoralis]
MVSADDRLQGIEARSLGRWGDPRLLLIVLVMVLGIAASGLLLAGRSDPSADAADWSLSQWLYDQGFRLIPGDLPPGVGVQGGERDLESKPWHQHRVCGRILQIVETACGYEAADRDSEVYWACVAGELKYTMWSAYGCS